ncbi:MAG: putative Ig domain-containing protein [Candidatus Bathyarchaeia archaeon]
MWRKIFIGFLVLMALPAVGKVTLQTGGSGEAEWKDKDLLVCIRGSAVELATYFGDDWAVVWLDCANKFTINKVTTELGIRYYHLQYNDRAGPRMVLALEKYDLTTGQLVHYLAISDDAPQTASCATFKPSSWCYSTWNGTDISSFNVNTKDCGNSLDDLKNELSGATVSAVGVLMGVVGWNFGAGEFGAGQAIVDDIVIKWNGSGGTYELERPWPVVYDFEDEDQWDDWTYSGLWRIVKDSELFGEPPVVTNFPSPTHAAYFGVPDPLTGKGSYNGSGIRVYGCLTSPENILNPGDSYVEISFDYFRLVEQYKGAYPNQVYDRTWVEFRWYMDGEWEDWETNPGTTPATGVTYDPKTGKGRVLWYKDSSYPPEGEWTHVNLPTLTIPPKATKIQFRFCFDSVDGYNNNYLGWLIDNVHKAHSPVPECLEILTEVLPQATVKQTYSATLTANKPGVRWELVVDPRAGFDPLPPRLSLDTGTGVISGEPEVGTEGTYRIKVRAVWGDGRDCNTAEKVFTLAIRSPTGANVVYSTSQNAPDDNWTGWSECPLWHMVNESTGIYVNGVNILQGYGKVEYFGQGEPNNPNYDTGQRVKCCLTSPLIPIPTQFVGEELVLGFKSWREVEYYDKGAYDKTWVEIRFEGQEWKTVWYKDSRDPSERAWTWELVHTGLVVPKNPFKVQIRFCFDSVDAYNNKYVGWIVDEITLYAGTTMLTITTPCPLPEGAVGQFYKVKLQTSGGPSGRKEWEVTNLPPGLGFNPTTEEITGVPREPGQWTVHIKVTVYDNGNPIASAEKDCLLKITDKKVLLFEDFEGDPKWQMSGLWHIRDLKTDRPTNVPEADHAHVAYYANQSGTWKNTYETGDRTTGYLTLQSPVIDLTGVTAVLITFDYWREVESYAAGEYDLTLVQIKLDAGPWTTVWKKSSKDPSEKAWTKATIGPIATGNASSMLIRFAFDSVDKHYNKFTGWLVDNILVESAPSGNALPLSAFALEEREGEPRELGKISVFNYPNPVRDVHTTTFVVRGVEADLIKVEVYDLTGRLVYVGEASGNELTWHTQDLFGRYLANGVYLYKVYVKVGETWIVSDIQKIVILR